MAPAPRPSRQGARRGPRRPETPAGWCRAGAALVLAVLVPPAAAQVAATADYLAKMDTDGDGRVSLAEYQAWMSYAFDAMDADRDGVLSPAEHYARRLLAAKADATPEGIEAVAELADVVRATVETLKQPAPLLRTQDALAARLGALRDSLPEAASGLAALVDAEGMDEVDVIPDAPLAPEAELTSVDMRAYGELAGSLQSVGPEVAAEDGTHDEAARLEAERLEAERLEAERAEAARLDAQRMEAQRLEAESEAQAQNTAADTAVAALLARVLANEDPDEALDTSRLDEELLDIFVEEAGDLLDHSDGLLAQLRESVDDREALVGLQRDLHGFRALVGERVGQRRDRD